jgi:WD40 repeat protein
VKTILVLAANPKNTPPLRLEQEIREIDDGLKRAQKRESFTLEQKLAARPVDVRRAMLDYKPSIVHFCGHGSGEEGIAFEDEDGKAKLVRADTLAEFFELFANELECVVLNACYSEIQAEAIAKHIPYVIGMNKAIGDTTAIEFSVAFYDALGAGESIDFAYKLACNAIRWTGLPEHLTPSFKFSPKIIAEKNLQSVNPHIATMNLPEMKFFPYKVFISYSRKDKDFAQKLALDLQGLNIGVWLDLWEITVGDSLLERIEQGISDADYVAVILSKHSVESKWVKEELRIALMKTLEGGQKIVLPILVEECEIPVFLTHRVYADFRDYPTGFEALLRVFYPHRDLERETKVLLESARDAGYLVPDFVWNNSLIAIQARLVPINEINLSILYWCAMEYWFEDNLESGRTQLTKWEQFDFMLGMAARMYHSERFMIRRRFFSEMENSAFDWKILCESDRTIQKTAFFLQGVDGDDFKFTHQSAIDFAIAVVLALGLNILRPELRQRISKTCAFEYSFSSILDRKQLPITILSFLAQLTSQDCTNVILDMLNKSSYERDYRSANLIALLRNFRSNDFSNLDFSGSRLIGADFSSINLSGSSMRHCILSQSNFAGAILDNGDWTGANISGIVGIDTKIKSLTNTPDGRYVAVGTDSGATYVYDTVKKMTHNISTRQQCDVLSMAIDTTSQRLFSASFDGSVKVTKIGRWEQIDTIFEWKNIVWQNAFFWHLIPDPSHNLFGVSEIMNDYIYMLRQKYSGAVTGIDISTDKKSIAVATYGGVLVLINLITHDLEVLSGPKYDHRGKAHYDSIWKIRFAGYKDLLASAGGPGETGVKLWDLGRRVYLGSLFPTEYCGNIRDFAFITRDDELVAGTEKGILYKWRTNNSRPISCIQAHNSEILSLSFSDVTNMLATSGKDGTVRIWDSETLTEMKVLKKHSGQVWGISHAVNGKILFSAGDDGKLFIWNADPQDNDFGNCIDTITLGVSAKGLIVSDLRAEDSYELASTKGILLRLGAIE